MKTVGRNDPCPCGSGKKYKKCCLDKVATPGPDLLTSSPASDLPMPESGPMIRPYAMARILDNPVSLKHLSPEQEARARELWSPLKLAALDTASIESQLRAYGIPYSPAALDRLTRGHDSAWEAADPWVALLKNPDRHALDFVPMAVCELRKRAQPDCPTLEMLDDWMQAGYALIQENRRAEACASWIRVWDALRPRFTPAMKTIQEAGDRLFRGMTQCLFNWVIDFQLECSHLGHEHPLAVADAIRFHLEYLAQFPHDTHSEHFRLGLPILMHCAGRFEESERMFLSIIEESPDRAEGYASFSNTLAWQGSPQGRDLPRALRLLEQALAYPVRNAKEYDLERRLANLREQLQSQTERS